MKIKFQVYFFNFFNWKKSVGAENRSKSRLNSRAVASGVGWGDTPPSELGVQKREGDNLLLFAPPDLKTYLRLWIERELWRAIFNNSS